MLQFIIALVVIGAVLWFINGAEWIDNTIKRLIQVVLVIVLVIMALRLVWPMTGLG